MDQIAFRGSRMALKTDQHVGARLRYRRSMLGLTQEQLAEGLDISYQQIQKYETGANRISAGRLYQMARALSVEVGYFFEGLDDADVGVEVADTGVDSRMALELVKTFGDISDQGVRSAVLELMRSLTDSAIGPERFALGQGALAKPEGSTNPQSNGA